MAIKIYNGPCDVTTPLSGKVQETFVVQRLALATVNLYTKYEVSTFTLYIRLYRDIKGNENAKIGGGLRGYGSPKVIGIIR